MPSKSSKIESARGQVLACAVSLEESLAKYVAVRLFGPPNILAETHQKFKDNIKKKEISLAKAKGVLSDRLSGKRKK